MLKLSKKVDYGLIALIHLAQNSERCSWCAREFAQPYNIPAQLMAKILQKMARRGIIKSHQGIHGGYALGRQPDLINVVEVIESIEGPFSITNCISETGYCVQFEKCTIKSPIHLLNDAVHLILKQLTLAQMIGQGMMQPKYNSDNSSNNLVTFSSLPIA